MIRARMEKLLEGLKEPHNLSGLETTKAYSGGKDPADKPAIRRRQFTNLLRTKRYRKNPQKMYPPVAAETGINPF